MNGSGCTPREACVADVRSFVDGRQRGGFWVENNRALKYITMLLPSIFNETLLHSGHSRGSPDGNHSRPVMVDLGAGMYGREGSPDDSDALALIAGFRDRVDVHAFEARPDKAEGLVIEGKRRNATAAFAEKHLFVHAMGAAASEGRLHFANCGGGTNWMVVDKVAHLQRGCQIKYEVPVTSLDDLTQTGFLKGRQLLYVKVDVEGSEVEVAKGMRQLLSQQKVELMSFEYAKNWNIPMFITAQHGQGRRVNSTQLDVLYNDPAQYERTLESFQSMMSGLGYDTYLLHGGAVEGKGRSGLNRSLAHDDGPHNTPWRATLVPVYGAYFHRSTFEICLRRHHFKQNWCWNDLLVIRRENLALKRRLLEVLHGTDSWKQFARCNFDCF